MRYELLWVEGLIASLLLVALAAACAARWSRPWLGRGILLLAALVPGGLGAGATVYCLTILGDESDAWMPVPTWLTFTLSWTLAFCLGTWLVMRAALRRPVPEAPPAAAAWPRLGLALVLAAAVLVQRTTFANLDLALKVQLANLRTEGGTLVIATLPPRVPDRDNAALVYEKAFPLLPAVDKVPSPQREKLPGWQNLDPAKIDFEDKDLLDFLKRLGPGLALLRQAAAMPDCWFESNDAYPQDPLGSFGGGVGNFRSGASYLALDALAHAAASDTRTALEDVAAMYGLARHLNDPAAVAFLVANSIEADAGRTLEAVFDLAPVRPEDPPRLTIEEGARVYPRMRRSLRFDEALNYSVFGVYEPKGTMTWLRFLLLSPWFPPGVSDAPLTHLFVSRGDFIEYRRAMAEARRLASRPYYEVHDDLEAFKQVHSGRHQGVAMLGLPAVGPLFVAAAVADARREVARTALALTAYRQKHGRFPERLDQLVPEFLRAVPVDPFDGQPLRLRRAGDNLLVYSIGPNRVDDGGTPSGAGANEGDLVFRLRGR